MHASVKKVGNANQSSRVWVAKRLDAVLQPRGMVTAPPNNHSKRLPFLEPVVMRYFLQYFLVDLWLAVFL